MSLMTHLGRLPEELKAPDMKAFWTHRMIAAVGIAWACASSCTAQSPAAELVAGQRASPMADTRTAIEPKNSAAISPQQVDPGQVTAGRQIAVHSCSACHAMDANSKSPNAEAPPLKNVLWSYNEDALATHLIEAIRVGHGDMPLFDFNVIGADALIAYLRSIRSAHDERED